MTITQFDTDLRALAERAKTRYPGEEARIERGLLLALNDHVELRPDGTATVRSGKDAEVVYHVAGHLCECPDFARAPDGRCKHRFSVALVTKAARPRVAYRATYRGEPGQAIRDEQMRVFFQADATDHVTRLYDDDRVNLQLHGRVDLAAAQSVADLAHATLQAIAEGQRAPGGLAC
jgi:hypothetical protein